MRESLPHAPCKLVSPSGRDVAQRQRGLAPSLRELDLPQAKTEGVLQIDKIRIRFALTRICQRAALSVICFANASSPKGRAEKPVRTAHLTNQSKPHADLFACCSFRHGLRRATFLREEGFGFTHNPNLSLPSGEMSRSDREGWLLLSVLPLHRGLLRLSVLPLHRWRGPPPLKGELSRSD